MNQFRLKTDASVSASSSGGNANSTLVTAPMATSGTPRKNPATRPPSVPTTVANVTATIATRAELATPAATRENTSRPNWSVPNQCWPLGGCSRAGGSWAMGS